MQYTAKGVHNRHFELLDASSTAVGKLDYTSWFSINAEIHLQDGSVYGIGSTNFWHTSIHMTKDGIEVCNIKYNWKGQTIVTFAAGGTYLIKHTGFFNSGFVLVNENERELISMKADFDWSKLSFNYLIETNDDYAEGKDVTLILLALYCTNQMKNRQAV